MLSPSLALEQFTYASGAFKRSPARPRQPVMAAAVVRDAAFYELVAEIREHEGQEVDNPPLLFNLVVALGFSMIVAGAVRLASQLL